MKQDTSKAIKAIMNGASGGFREQAADLKRVGKRLKNKCEIVVKLMRPHCSDLDLGAITTTDADSTICEDASLRVHIAYTLPTY